MSVDKIKDYEHWNSDPIIFLVTLRRELSVGSAETMMALVLWMLVFIFLYDLAYTLDSNDRHNKRKLKSLSSIKYLTHHIFTEWFDTSKKPPGIFSANINTNGLLCNHLL